MTQSAMARLSETSQAAVIDDPLPRFAEENAKFWLPFTEKIERTSAKCVLVDFLVPDPCYYIGNAAIAKYLQSFIGCDVLALVPNDHVPMMRKVARSFGIDRVIVEPSHAEPDQKFLPAVGRIIGHMKKDDRKKRLLELSVNSVAIGDLVYDSYIRHSGKSELTTLDDDVVRILYDSLARLDHYTRVLRQFDVVATVQGHVVYQRFGILARLALQEGASVYCRKFAESRFTVRHYRRLEDATQYEYRFSQQEFNLVWDGIRNAAIAGGREYLTKRLAGQHDDMDAAQAFGSDKKHYTRQELTASLGLSPERPIAFIMPHVLCDSPHANSWFLYPDFHEWLVQTLEGAVANDRVNWIIKPHPSEHLASGDTTAKMVAAPIVRGVSHVAFAPADLNTAALPQLADVIVTGIGTPGMELPAMGVPTILAGESPYSGFGFTIEPTSREEYQHLLASIENVPELSREQMERALVYLYLYMELSRVESALVPNLGAAPGRTIEETNRLKLVEATKMVRGFRSVEEDPVYVNFKKQVEEGAEHMLNFDWLGR